MAEKTIPASPKSIWEKHPWLRKKLQVQLDKLAAQIHEQAVAKWAREDNSPVPTLEEARQQAEGELRTLLNGLGPLAALNPGEYFKRDWFDFTGFDYGDD